MVNEELRTKGSTMGRAHFDGSFLPSGQEFPNFGQAAGANTTAGAERIPLLRSFRQRWLRCSHLNGTVPQESQPRRKREGTAADLIPPNANLNQLRVIAERCKACHLWGNATQTVFGEGPSRAKIMFVGEQPGNEEDLAGRPFVGPAGRLLNEALEKAGLDRSKVYVTNVVKHFKFIRRGKRRIHDKPRASEINACRPWLDAEIDRLAPEVIVCLGATAAQTLLGKGFRVSVQRGEWINSDLAPSVMATVHPSALLRIDDEMARHQETARFIGDIKKAAQRLSRKK
jgi:DNA polymerase